jgi:aquaporin Z
MKKYVAEAFGTGVLAFMVGLSVTSTFVVPTPILAGLVLGLFVYSIGHLSGAHINPAVTIGAWSIGKIKTAEAGKYVASQFIGAGTALVLLSVLGVTLPPMMVSNDLTVGLAEMIGMVLFTFGIASVVYGRTPGPLSGIVVGGSLLGGIAIAVMLGSNGVLNPAVALTLGSFGVMYILGPIFGSVLGMQLYKLLEK